MMIVDFQAHTKSKIIFSENVTTIIGPTDTGKSSLIRALFWLAFNRPRGSSFTRKGSDGSKVKLLVDDRVVVRSNGKRGNNYIVDNRKLKSFGAGVPEEASSLLNISEVSFQRQHDQPFWLSLSPGEVSRELNQIINLSLIDSTLFNIGSFLRKTNYRVEESESRLRSLTRDRDEILWGKEASSSLEVIEKKASVIESKASHIAAVQSLLGKASLYAAEHRRASEAKLAALLAESKAKSLLAVSDRVTSLESLINRYESFTRTIKVKLPKKEVNIMDSKLEQLRKLANKITTLRGLLIQCKDYKDEACELQNQYLRESEDLKESLKGVCPVCLKPI